jgi:hypothetical protein
MKKLIQALIIAALAFSATAAFSAHHEKDEKVLRHIVCLKFNDEATEQKIGELMEMVTKLPQKIPQIIDFEWGKNVSSEGNDKGFTHCITFTFEDEKGLEKYLPHKDHLALVEVLKPLVADVFVVDYWAK